MLMCCSATRADMCTNARLLSRATFEPDTRGASAWVHITRDKVWAAQCLPAPPIELNSWRNKAASWRSQAGLGVQRKHVQRVDIGRQIIWTTSALMNRRPRPHFPAAAQRDEYSRLWASRGAARDVGCLATQPCHRLTPFYQSRLTQTQLIVSLQAVGKCRTPTAPRLVHENSQHILWSKTKQLTWVKNDDVTGNIFIWWDTRLMFMEDPEDGWMLWGSIYSSKLIPFISQRQLWTRSLRFEHLKQPKGKCVHFFGNHTSRCHLRHFTQSVLSHPPPDSQAQTQQGLSTISAHAQARVVPFHSNRSPKPSPALLMLTRHGI